MSQSIVDMPQRASTDGLPTRGACGADPSCRAALVAEIAADSTATITELELAALLESHGVTDAVATGYKAHDVFDLARQLVVDLRSGAVPSVAEQAVSPLPPLPRLLPTLMRGPLMFIMIAMSMAGLRFYEAALRGTGAPIWATTFGLAVGMLVAGGIMSGLGWRLSVALSQQTADTIPALVALGLAIGLGVAASVGLLLAAAGFLLHLGAAGLAGLGISCLGLTFWLLLSGTLIVLDRLFVASAAPGLAFGIAWIADRLWLSAYGPLAAPVLGYGFLVVLLGGWLMVLLYRLGGRHQKRRMLALPPIGQIVYNGLPYIGYGAFAVLYVFVGPVGGWFGHLTPGWTREPVIAAVNIVHLLGFGTVILSQGVTEYALRTFWRTVLTAEQLTTFSDLASVRAAVWRFVRRHVGMLLAVQVVLAYSLARLAPWLWREFDLAPVLGPLVPELLFTSLIGYTYLAWGMFGCSLLVALAQPWLAARALLIATAIQLGCMLILDLSGGFQAAILGSVIGSACLVLITQHTLKRLFDRIDYTLYRAF